jgi:hypothetical protein
VRRLKAELGIEPGYRILEFEFHPYKQAELLLFDAYAHPPRERGRGAIVMVGGGKWGGKVWSRQQTWARLLGDWRTISRFGLGSDDFAPLYDRQAFVLRAGEETFGRCVC